MVARTGACGLRVAIWVDVAEEDLNGNQSESNAAIQPDGQLSPGFRALLTAISGPHRAESDAAIREEGQLPPEVRALLAAIPGPHQAKKRRTVVRLAFARANEEPLAHVFDATDTCDARVWWQKWQYIPEVRAAHDAVLAHVLQALDSETAAIEAHYRRLRRQAVARHASEAPAALADVMTGASQKGSDRINAAVTLVRLAAGQDAQPVAAGSEVRSESNVGVEIRPINYRAAIAALAPTEAGSMADSAASGAD